MSQRLLVIGGNGFVGSAVCKQAVAKGWSVTSVSRRGTPFKARSGHIPQWTNKVNWVKGTAQDTHLLSDLVKESTATVSTLGVLFEGSPYKNNSGIASPLSLVKKLTSGTEVNPLDRGSPRTYKEMNHDVHLEIARICAEHSQNSETPYPFVFVSAEDVTRPFIPRGYIEWKRKAERDILHLNHNYNDPLRPIFVRPSIIYDPHINPWTTVPATLVDMSARIRPHLPSPFPLRTYSSYDSLPSFFVSMDAATRIPPVHVETVGSAIIKSIADESIDGILDVKRMRNLLGFDDAFDLYET